MDLRWKLSKGRKLARRMDFQGLDVSVETDKGEYRHWYDPHNEEHGKTKMLYPYGYVKRTNSLGDDEQIDIYVGPDEDSDTLYVVNQLKAPDFEEFDELKVMAGFKNDKEAKEAYLAHYNSPKFFGSMYEMTIDQFKNSFVKKSFDQQLPQPSFSYDVDDIRNVEHWFNNIGTLKDKDLLALSAEIWGPGYVYMKTREDHVRAELRGFLHDQYEMLSMQPPVPQTEELP